MCFIVFSDCSKHINASGWHCCISSLCDQEAETLSLLCHTGLWDLACLTICYPSHQRSTPSSPRTFVYPNLTLISLTSRLLLAFTLFLSCMLLFYCAHLSSHLRSQDNKEAGLDVFQSKIQNKSHELMTSCQVPPYIALA